MKYIEYTEHWDFHYTHTYILVDRDVCVGRINIEITEEYTKIASLYVQDKYRGKGYSKKLLKKALKYCKKYVVDDIFLSVRSDNFIKKMYADMGFQKTETNRNYIWMKYDGR